MLFRCRPEGERIPGRFPGPPHPRGKWFTIDIHCHWTSLKAAAMVEGNEAVSKWYLETHANAASQAINRQNAVRTRPQGASAEQRIADMDLMGIDRRCRRRRGRPITAPIRSSGWPRRAS
jgi:hypothetical protein